MEMNLSRNDSFPDDTISIEKDVPRPTTTLKSVDLLTYEQSMHIMRILMYGVTPVISALGVVGNIFSIIILLKHGLHKSSNILLISLAFTDLTFLIAFNSAPKILYEVVGIENAYNYDRDTAFALYVLYQVFNVLDYGMGNMSLTMPMLITIERLIAVFLPFKFNLIVTPSRSWFVVAITYIFWYTVIIYISFWTTFVYRRDVEYNITVGVMTFSKLYYDNPHTVELLNQTIAYISMKISPVFTFVGCLLISIKIKVASNQRKKMIKGNSKEASSNRTTKMLLAVCVVYMLACTILSLPTYIPQYMYYSMTSDVPSNIGRVMYQVINIAVCINSSANFVIYVVMNKNFRDTYKSLFVVCMDKRK